MAVLSNTENATLVMALAKSWIKAGPLSATNLLNDRGATLDEPPRQELLGMLQRGLSCREIAAELALDVPVVKACLMRLYRQAGQHRRMPH